MGWVGPEFSAHGPTSSGLWAQLPGPNQAHGPFVGAHKAPMKAHLGADKSASVIAVLRPSTSRIKFKFGI